MVAVGIGAQAQPVSGSETPAVGAIDYGPMRVAGRLGDPRVNESSGLALSHANSDAAAHFWTHNDSGDTPRLFLMTANGVVVHEIRLDVPRAIDWEDMCSFVHDGVPYLLVGDVGDNEHRRRRVTLWLLRDPAWAAGQTDGTPQTVPAVRKIDFTYADGPQDCESIAFDPTSNTVVIVTKILPQRTTTIDTAGVYLLPLPEADTDDAVVLERVADLPLRITVGMDISPDGRRAVVATYGDGWEFARGDGDTWADAFARPPRQIALGPRGQSEAVAYGPDGATLYFTAEGEKKPVWKVAPQRK